MSILSIAYIALITLSGGFIMYRKWHVAFTKNEWAMIFLCATSLVVISLLISTTRPSGTIEWANFGWPHVFLLHAIRDIIDNTPINRWSLSARAPLYIFANFLFYCAFVFPFFVWTKKNKMRWVVIGTGIGLITAIITYSFFLVCEKNYQIPNGGSYTSEDVFGCLIPLTPTFMVPFLAQKILQLQPEALWWFNINVFHFIFYTFIGMFIGWIVYKKKRV